MDLIADLWTPAAGLSGIGLLAVLGVLTGRLWPLRNVLQLNQPLRERLVEIDAENKTLKETNQMLLQLVVEHLEGLKLGVRSMQAVKELAEQRAQSVDPPTMQLPAVVPYGRSTVYQPVRR